jgi:hypothetical protein
MAWAARSFAKWSFTHASTFAALLSVPVSCAVGLAGVLNRHLRLKPSARFETVEQAPDQKFDDRNLRRQSCRDSTIPSESTRMRFSEGTMCEYRDNFTH